MNAKIERLRGSEEFFLRSCPGNNPVCEDGIARSGGWRRVAARRTERELRTFAQHKGIRIVS